MAVAGRYQVELVVLREFLVLAWYFLGWLSAPIDYQSTQPLQTYFYACWLAFGTCRGSTHCVRGAELMDYLPPQPSYPPPDDDD